MVNQDEERCLSAIKKTLEFYNKKWSDNDRQFWRYYLRQVRNPELFLDALRQYPATGRFAPKPADITAIMEEIRPPKNTYKEPDLTTDCPDEVRRAWIYWMNEFWQMPIIANADLKALKQDKEVISEDQAEAWLILVNEEAKKYNLPDSIPDTHKLQEIWV